MSQKELTQQNGNLVFNDEVASRPGMDDAVIPVEKSAAAADAYYSYKDSIMEAE